jgi:hypothetical protein
MFLSARICCNPARASDAGPCWHQFYYENSGNEIARFVLPVLGRDLWETPMRKIRILIQSTTSTMVRSVLASRVARLAAAPAATIITTTSFYACEKSFSTASNRVAQTTLSHGLQQQRRALSDSVKLLRDTKTMSTSRFKSTITDPTEKTFVQWYEMHLQASPVPTKMVTGGILWGVGDCVAQVVPAMTQIDEAAPFEYDFVRTGRACFYGFGIHAPLSHLHFNFLEYLTIRVGVKGLGITVFKTFMEQVSCSGNMSISVQFFDSLFCD